MNTYQMIVPDCWSRLTYIFMFYFIGCYFKDYKLKISMDKNVVALFVALAVFGLFNYYRAYNNLFGSGGYAYYNSIETLVITYLLIKINIGSKYIKIISKILYLTFGAYLLSAIFDDMFY